jgi:hypothetical protein
MSKNRCLGFVVASSCRSIATFNFVTSNLGNLGSAFFRFSALSKLRQSNMVVVIFAGLHGLIHRRFGKVNSRFKQCPSSASFGQTVRMGKISWPLFPLPNMRTRSIHSSNRVTQRRQPPRLPPLRWKFSLCAAPLCRFCISEFKYCEHQLPWPRVRHIRAMLVPMFPIGVYQT